MAELDDPKPNEPTDPKPADPQDDPKPADPKPSDPEPKAGDEPKYTEAQMDEIVRKKIARERKKAEEAKSEAERLAGMNATEKAEYELKQMREKLEGLERDKNRSELTSTARKMLSEANVSVPDALLHNLVTDEAETTKEAVDAFTAAFKSAVDAGVNEALKRNPPKDTGGSNSNKKSAGAMAAEKYNQRIEASKPKE